MPENERKLSATTVGYAMPPNKVETVVQPSLVAHAKARGIHLIQVDIDKPLVEQGPFDCLVHKVYGEDWKVRLHDFKFKYPEAIIIDSPIAIERLHNRLSMLEVVNHLPDPVQQSQGYSFGIPKQAVINADDDAHESFLNMSEKLNFPVIAKPLLANSSDNAHEMSLVYSSHGLKKVKPPVVLQEFVNHGGVLFKVYVAGNHVKCVKRKSLPDIHVSDAAKFEGQGDIMSFSQISSSAAGDDDTHIKEVEMPSPAFVHSLAQGLREASKLHLFNFDMIKDAREGNKYLIIDINYFPGYAKVPGFENMLTDFFCDIINHKNEAATAPVSTEIDVSKNENCITVLYNHIVVPIFRLINRTTR
ncbi:hypothetical protein BVRB_6g150860 [Beta vulgaris subsp. vulgaris]|uniref:inositol-tetrakisphosphate 1-kinase 1 n=1 Tax=Beta vulgaris subsp. vulgaris TaxID=3555 RepID=UPI00053F58FA|nr:inositol-tetrakisphosphate 1-kinase 1 [Beta vulgaris subsp. vulgaris]KMT07468.1 hypothetical protein BVRB_6g150860 [Beta vulgaris subsp. vulgaris]